MIIKCHGARGSIPVSGPEYIKYGGDTTCLEIRTQNDEIIIVDAGSGIRRLGNQLLAAEKYNYHLIFTPLSPGSHPGVSFFQTHLSSGYNHSSDGVPPPRREISKNCSAKP